MPPLRSRSTIPALLLALGCSGASDAAPESPAPAPASEAAETATSEETESPEAGPIPEAWVAERLADARSRLEASEAGRLVWQATEAHGGLGTWLAQGTVAFTFDYQPLGAPARRMHTEQQVDLWRARARHVEVEGDDAATLGWDGERAWIHPGPEAFPTPARFWALTPYYFVGMPFVVADPGARHARLDDATLDGTPCDLVKVSYEDGTGDSPDDYYVLYLAKDSHRLVALRYVVAYPGFFPEGGHTPEKLMRYTAFGEVAGLSIAGRLDTYAYDPDAGEPGEKVTEIAVAEVRFGERYAATHFAPVAGAVVSTTIEANAR